MISMTEKKSLDWLEKHQNADEIVVDADTGFPAKAIYSTVGGIPRVYVAEYFLVEGLLICDSFQEERNKEK